VRGCRIIAPRRSNIAHLRRPRRATSSQRRPSPACLQEGVTTGRLGSGKISKTTPCKVAGGRRPAPWANERNGVMIAKSVQATAGAQRRLFAVASGETLSPLSGGCSVTPQWIDAILCVWIALWTSADGTWPPARGLLLRVVLSTSGERKWATTRLRAASDISFMHCHRKSECR
jgi:hypothetical protein